MSIRDRLSEVRGHGRDPDWWMERAVPYVANTVMQEYLRARRKRNAINFLDEPWDNLIILDACRYDMFADLNSIDGELSSRISPGTSTEEFLPETFASRSCHDTVYVTASPMYRIKKWTGVDLSGTFHAIEDVWDWGWDGELRTVPPGTMADATIHASHEYPQKRIIAHFMQPHYPFIGDRGRGLGEHTGMENSRALAFGRESESERDNIWRKLQEGDVPQRDVWAAYRENLEIALPDVKRTVDGLPGRTVVTSDHGNMVGEYATPFPVRKYGHPKGWYTKQLATVPWLYIDGSAKDVVSESPEHPRDTISQDTVENRLKSLGYV